MKISQQREKSETHKAKLYYLFTSHGSLREKRGNLIESFLCSDDRISVNTHIHTHIYTLGLLLQFWNKIKSWWRERENSLVPDWLWLDWCVMCGCFSRNKIAYLFPSSYIFPFYYPSEYFLVFCWQWLLCYNTNCVKGWYDDHDDDDDCLFSPFQTKWLCWMNTHLSFFYWRKRTIFKGNCV